MAAALRAAEGGVYFSKILRGGIFKIFPARGGIPPYPPIPDPCIDVHQRCERWTSLYTGIPQLRGNIVINEIDEWLSDIAQQHKLIQSDFHEIRSPITKTALDLRLY